MARAAGTELAERLELVELQAARAAQVQQGVDEGRTMPAGEDEAIAVGPGRVLGVEVQELQPEGRRDVRQAERDAGMAALRLFNHVRGQAADRVRAQLQLFVRQFHVSSSLNRC